MFRSTQVASSQQIQGWDLRAAVCAVAATSISEQSDETIAFLLSSAIDELTLNDLFSELFRRYQRRVTTWCYRFTRDPDCVPDLVQEVFLKAFRRLCTYRGDSRFSTWLYVITRNHCLNALKKLGTDPIESSEAIPLDLPGADWQGVQRLIERNELFSEMWRVIHATLTPTEARIMALHYGHGLSIAVITRQLTLTNPSGAKAYIVNARRKLKAVLRTERLTGVAPYGTNTNQQFRAAS